MLSILLDTGLFAIPPYAVNQADILEIILRISDWSTLVKGRAPFRAYQLSEAQNMLHHKRCVANEPDLRELFKMANLTDVLSVRDVLTAYILLISKAIVLCEHFNEAVEFSDFRLDPDILSSQSPKEIVDQTRLVYLNQCFALNQEPRNPMYVASGLPAGHPKEPYLIGRIDKILCQISASVNCPVNVKGKLKLISSIIDILNVDKPINIWNDASDIEDFFLAISLGCVEIGRQKTPSFSLNDLPDFSIGSGFLKSLRETLSGPNQPYAAVTLETCCRLIMNAPKNPVTDFRLPKGAKTPKNNAVAQRTHITKGHEALRLMLWRTTHNLELANVGRKKELRIEENHGPAYSSKW